MVKKMCVLYSKFYGRCYIAKGPATWCVMYGIWYWWLNWYCWPQIVRSHYLSRSLSTPFTSTHSTPFIQPLKKTTWLSATSHWI